MDVYSVYVFFFYSSSDTVMAHTSQRFCKPYTRSPQYHFLEWQEETKSALTWRTGHHGSGSKSGNIKRPVGKEVQILTRSISLVSFLISEHGILDVSQLISRNLLALAGSQRLLQLLFSSTNSWLLSFFQSTKGQECGAGWTEERRCAQLRFENQDLFSAVEALDVAEADQEAAPAQGGLCG